MCEEKTTITAVEDDFYEVLEIAGLDVGSVIFTYGRIDPTTVSDKLHIYEVRENEEGEPETIEPNVSVNFGGTIISISSIPMGDNPDKHFDLTEDNFGYEGWESTYENYLKYKNYLDVTADDDALSFFEWDEREQDYCD